MVLRARERPDLPGVGDPPDRWGLSFPGATPRTPACEQVPAQHGPRGPAIPIVVEELLRVDLPTEIGIQLIDTIQNELLRCLITNAQLFAKYSRFDHASDGIVLL